jgi:hypothetical protein
METRSKIYTAAGLKSNENNQITAEPVGISLYYNLETFCPSDYEL